MVLDHITDSADLFVKGATTLDTEALRLSDLNIIDKIAVPEWFEETISKTEVEKILNSLLTQVVINPKYCGFGKDFMQLFV